MLFISVLFARHLYVTVNALTEVLAYLILPEFKLSDCTALHAIGKLHLCRLHDEPLTTICLLLCASVQLIKVHDRSAEFQPHLDSYYSMRRISCLVAI